MVIFSIVTPFYKGNKYVPNLIKMVEKNADALKEANIESKIEFIIVNDSPDVKVELPDYRECIDVKVINQEKNGGIHYARIVGLDNCTGEYILFLDQDDEISDRCLLEEYKVIKDSDVVVANALFEHSDGTTSLHFKGKGQYKNAFELPPYVKGHNRIISPGQCLIRKDAIPREWKEYVMKVNGSDDLFLWILLLLLKKKFTKIEKPLYVHKYTGGNLSAEGEKMSKSSLEMAEYLKKIDYVPYKVIKNIIRSRSFKSSMAEKNIIMKILFIIKNADIFIMRAIWKLRAGIGRIKYTKNDL